jgi:osmoprotectant transport system substrate-binding protein
VYVVTRKWWIVQLPLLLVVALLVAACGGGEAEAPAEDGASNGAAEGSTTIAVGSKDFTEQFILGHMYALALEDAGFEVERKLNLGGTDVAQAALESGEIDLYPEYTGTGLLTVLKLPADPDRENVYNTVSEGYEEQYDLIWLEPAPMNNTQALAMTQEKSEELGIETISDMAEQAESLVMVGPAEFQEREDGLLGLKEVYGDFELQEYKAVDPGLRYQALIDDEADVAVAFGTDGQISAYDLVVLEDDQNLFPPYQVAPVVREDTLEANADIADTLNSLSPLLTSDVMRRLNFEVDGEQRDPEEVAREFLVEEGLISE